MSDIDVNNLIGSISSSMSEALAEAVKNSGHIPTTDGEPALLTDNDYRLEEIKTTLLILAVQMLEAEDLQSVMTAAQIYNMVK